MFALRNIIKISLLLTILTVNYCSQSKEIQYYAYLSNGDKCNRNCDFEEAEKLYKKAVEIKPNSEEAYQKLGSLYQYDIKNMQKAIDTYSQGLEYFPNNFNLNLNIMYAYFNQNQIDAAIKHYKIVAANRPNNIDFSFPKESLDLIISEFNDEEIVEYCNKFLSINPTDKNLREELVKLYKNKLDYANWEKEVIVLIKYLKNDQEKGRFYFDLGSIYYHYEKYEESKEQFLLSRKTGFPVPKKIFDKLDEKLK
jgi:tetratricopeptide (TPR) repeat protein